MYIIAVVYITIVILLAHWFAPDSYIWTRNTISDLAAQGYAYAWLMRLGFIGFGGLVLFGGVWKVVRSLKTAWPHSLVAVYGMAVMLSGIFSTMPFTPGSIYSVGQAALHSDLAALAGLAISIAMLLFMLTDSLPGRKVVHLSALILTLLFSGAFTVFDSLAGIFQRFLYPVGFAWLIFLEFPRLELPVRGLKKRQPGDKTDIKMKPEMFDWYTHYYSVVASSHANALYCEKVYGKNLCQHGFAEMDHLDHLIQVGEIKNGTQVLDLGCGNGMISEFIADKTGASVTGIDFIEGAIQQASNRTKFKRGWIKYLTMDMHHLNFPAQSFDVIVSIDTLYFGDAYEILKPMLPLLKPGGRLVVFFDQSAGPEVDLETYPKESILPDGTDLAVALNRLGLTYQTWDYTEKMLVHLRKRKPVLAELKEQFEIEENQFLYENHLGEAEGIERAYINAAGARYLYLVKVNGAVPG